MKLTPDQLHSLIDEVAALVERDSVSGMDIVNACYRAECLDWWPQKGRQTYYAHNFYGGYGGHAGLSAVLILLSEGG